MTSGGLFCERAAVTFWVMLVHCWIWMLMLSPGFAALKSAVTLLTQSVGLSPVISQTVRVLPPEVLELELLLPVDLLLLLQAATLTTSAAVPIAAMRRRFTPSSWDARIPPCNPVCEPCAEQVEGVAARG